MAKMALVPGPVPPHKIPQFGVSGDSHPRKPSSEPCQLTLNIDLFGPVERWTRHCGETTLAVA
jgi:hypothetical protein